MTIKVKMREGKAITRFNNDEDEKYFIHTMILARDKLGYHPKIIIKDRDDREIKSA